MRSVEAGADTLCVDDAVAEDVREAVDVRECDCRRTSVAEVVEGSGENTLVKSVYRNTSRRLVYFRYEA